MARFDEKTGERLPDETTAASKPTAPQPEQKPQPEPAQGEAKPQARRGNPAEKGGK